MKKVFLLLTMLWLAFTGSIKAESLTVYDGTVQSYYAPAYIYYFDAVTRSQYVIPAADLSEMAGGMISSLTYYSNKTSAYTTQAVANVYVKEVDYTTISAYEDVSTATMVYSGYFNFDASGLMTITFDTPFMYGGGNLLIAVENPAAGSYTSVKFYGQTVNGACVSASSSSLSGVAATQRNFIPKTTFDYVAGGAATITTDPTPLALGYRPNGAWSAPYVFNVVNNGGPVDVTGFSFNDSYFSAEADLPATVYAGNPLRVEVTTGEAEAGLISTEMAVIYDGGRNFETFEITATAYDPTDGDVWENAIAVPEMEFRTPVTENFGDFYKNYELPDGTQAPDGVYQVTLTEDALLYAGTDGGSAFLYTEDFEGVGGPAEDNNYVYNGPQVNPGPLALWFYYEYTGANTFFGSSTGGGMVFGYKITPEDLQELGLGNCAITTVEAAAREGSYYDLLILKGGDTPDFNNMVYYQEFDDYDPLYFFDINLDEPQFLGDDENIWVMLYSDSPYAAYCGKQPVDVDNGKIWYTTNLETWYSNTTYTPVIYTRFMELPTGREVTVNLADMKVRESNGATGELGTADGSVMNVAKAQTRGRDVQELTVFDGTETNNHVPAYVFYFDDFTRSQHVLPATELSDMAGGEITSIKYYTTSANIPYTTASTADVFVKEVANETISEYIDKSTATMVYQGTLDFVAAGTGGELTITFNAPYTYNGGNLLIGIENTTDAGYKNIAFYGQNGHTGAAIAGSNGTSAASAPATAYAFLPKTTFTYTPAGGDEPGGGGDEPAPYEPYIPDFSCQIEGLYVPAGTYYLVAATENAAATVTMAIAEVPGPEIPTIISPVDGETNVMDPYLAMWQLGDYTAEMQVLVGTQYPPTTPLIDWTDYLVESAFLTDLVPNQSYFMQVKARNAAGTVKSEIVAFTTPVDPVENFAVEDDHLYPGDAAMFSWDANRAFKGYNIYKDGEKVNEALITTNTYAVEGLEYNMEGYSFQVTAVYDAAESLPSDPVVVYMTGNGTVSGAVYDIDEEHPLAGATVMFEGTDEYGEAQEFYVTGGEDGTFEGEILAGQYTAYVATEGLDPTDGVLASVVYGETTSDIILITHEFYYPLSMIKATEEENDVLVEWSWTPAEMVVNFETGDFSQANFVLPTTYPWAITTTNPHEGTYCMKSTCEGVASASSTIEAVVEVPYDGKMGFWVKVSSEANYDKFHFYIDGVEKGAAISGDQPYAYKEFDVTEGTHTYKWEYAKDSSVNSNDDCVYVDDITLYRYEAPLPPVVGATTYDFDDSSMMGWTSIDADGDGNGWVSSANPGIYHNAGVSLSGTGHNSSEAYVISGSYANQTGQALTPDNYLVSPAQISAEAGAQIQFWACAQDASYAAEHFGVAVSTTTATASAFTTIQEWTMTAKNAPVADNSKAVRGILQGTWYQYSVDLSAYAGQDIWVAIRHFNCTDMFILNVDDITLATGGSKMAPRGDRSLVSYNLYRRNNIVNEEPELIAAGLNSDVYEYIDTEWPSLPFGEYQWGIQATYEGYVNAEPTRDETTYDFEDSSFQGWTTIDGGSPSGYGWQLASTKLGTGYGHNGSSDCVLSQSYDNNYGVVYPDNFLISPAKAAYTSISFYACGQDASYAGEHFGVAVSTGGATASDFTMVQEWTMTAKGEGVLAPGRGGNNRAQGNWYQYTVDLSSYAGADIWVAIRHFNCSDMFYLDVDDITLTTGGTPGPGPGPGPQPGPTGDGLSEIIWSNVIDKDMISDVTLNVALNNGQAPVGVPVVITGNDFAEEYVMDETGTLNLELRKGVYNVAIEFAGYTSVDDVMTIDDDVEEVTFVLYELIAPVEDLYVSPTGWAMWEGGTVGPTPPGPTPPGPGPQPGPEETYDFEDSSFQGWTTIDGGSPSGYGWQVASTKLGTGYGHNGSSDCVLSQSYDNNYGVVYPDNFLISPAKAGYTQISFYACGQDASYAGEHFGVAVSTGGATASDFTMVQEWTMTAKGEGVPAPGRGGNNRAQGNWYQYTVDLSSYAGADIWVAIRHFNCSDMFYLDVDDITLTTASKGNRAPLSYKVFLGGEYVGESIYPFYQLPVGGMTEGESYTVSVVPLYATGMGEAMSYTFVYDPCDNYEGATEYAATVNDDDVTLTWTVNSTPGPGPGPGPQPGPEETYDFEDSSFQGWTTIDGGSPSGYGWQVASTKLGTGYGHNGSLDCVLSQSYDNNYGVVYPDNFLISPAKAGYTQISFYACGQDASYAGEHFGVAVSTGGATASDFTMVQEWTMTAKGEGVPAPGRGGNNRAQGNWYQYTVDLSSYAGADIWVAIRHFNCSDMFYLDVDDITLTTAAKGGRTVLYEPHFVTDPGAMANGADASWTKNGQTTWGPNCNNGGGYKMADEFTLDAASTITEIEVYGYQTGSTTTSTFTGLYAVIYDGAPNANGQIVWGDETANIMTATSFTNCYRGSDGETAATTRPIMAITATGLNIELPAGTYYLAWSLAGSASSGPWAGVEALPEIGNTGNGLQLTSNGWTALTDSGAGTPYGAAFKLVGEGGGPGPGPQPTPGDYLGVMVWRDGEPLTLAPIQVNTLTDENVEPGEHEYTIRVVYDDYSMSCDQSVTVTIGGSPVVCDPVTNLIAYYAEDPTYGDGVVIEWVGNENANSYGIYVADQYLGSTPEESVFIYGLTLGATYTFGIVAEYDNCQSDMVTIEYTHYDAVEENEVVNAIYPNPTSSDLHINATAMTHVTVYNAMGQMVYDQEVSGDEVILNMGQYEAGVYMVKVTTETGSSVKRINVVK